MMYKFTFLLYFLFINNVFANGNIGFSYGDFRTNFGNNDRFFSGKLIGRSFEINGLYQFNSSEIRASIAQIDLKDFSFKNKKLVKDKFFNFDINYYLNAKFLNFKNRLFLKPLIRVHQSNNIIDFNTNEFGPEDNLFYSGGLRLEYKIFEKINLYGELKFSKDFENNIDFISNALMGVEYSLAKSYNIFLKYENQTWVENSFTIEEQNLVQGGFNWKF